MSGSSSISSSSHHSSFAVEWTQLQPQPDPSDGGHGTPLARSSHGVSYLRSKDMLLVYGGEHVARTPIVDDQSFWICRNVSSPPSKDKACRWKRMSPPPKDSSTTSRTQPPPRIAHAQAVVADRYLYVFGGRAGVAMQERAMNDLWVLDTLDDDNVDHWRWTQVVVQAAAVAEEEDKPCPRSFHRMVAVGADLYVFGGCGASGRLNDLWKFDTVSQRWHALGSSRHLRGRGGPNLVVLRPPDRIAVIAGFAGEETNDGHAFRLSSSKWEEHPLRGLDPLRPRSVCGCAALSVVTNGAGEQEEEKEQVVVIVGGEVDPSNRGHEGAGGFAGDVVVLDGGTGAWRQNIAAPATTTATTTTSATTTDWPAPRGWSDCDSNGGGGDTCWMFGGLTGDDAHPVRLGDLWRMKLRAVRKEE